MGEDGAAEWPDDDADPFGGITHDTQVSEESVEETPSNEDKPSLKLESIEPAEPSNELESVVDKTEVQFVEPQPNVAEGWTLPVRAAPLLHQFHNEEVTEFPLQQTVDGRESVSLIVDDDLLRIIETRLDPDGQRRMKVSLSMMREITGFKHHHNQLLHKHQFLWIGTTIWGLLFLFLLSNTFVYSILGTVLTAVGAWNWMKMHLETHILEFSNSGGSLSYTLRGYGNDRPFYRASMAYIGSEMAHFLRTGTLETEAVLELHANLAAPPPALPAPEPQITTPPALPAPEPQITTPPVVHPAAPEMIATGLPNSPQPTPPQKIPPPPQNIPPSAKPMVGPPVETSIAAPAVLPPAPVPPPATIPSAPLPHAPPPPSTPLAPLPHAPPPPSTPLPPAPAPPPMVGGPMPLPPLPGIPGAPIPLDAPMPNAPEVAVTASPVEETLSEAEQNDLLNELS